MTRSARWKMITLTTMVASIGFGLQMGAYHPGALARGNPHWTPTAVPVSSATSTPKPTATSAPVPTATRTPLPPSTATPTATGGSSIKTVFLIVEENHNWSSFYGSSSAPYINGTLLPQSSYATNYKNPPGLHPSEPNYLWLEAGTNCFSDTGCITDDNPPSSHATGSTAHLATLLNNAGMSWKAYQENISDGTCPVKDSGSYAVKHDPFMFFTDVTGNSAYCTSHVRGYSDLSTDLTNNAVARFNFITPNLCDDGHDSCSPTNNPVKQTDTWLSQQIPMIMSSAAYKNGGAIFITWDEGEGGSDGPIGMIVLSPLARGGGYNNSISYTHSSTLRTMEEIFHVSPMLGDAAKATDLSDLFATFP